jgi:hypothetical protein
MNEKNSRIGIKLPVLLFFSLFFTILCRNGLGKKSKIGLLLTGYFFFSYDKNTDPTIAKIIPIAINIFSFSLSINTAGRIVNIG